MQEAIDGLKAIRGRVRPHYVFKRRYASGAQQPLHFCRNKKHEWWYPAGGWDPNLVVYEWGAIVGKLLTVGELKYRIGGMYLEFEDVAAPGNPVSAPVFDRTRDIEYYNNLGSGGRDYLRVALTAATFGSSNAARYPKGNQPVFFARSQGVQGVHGTPFGYANNSVIFGAALVAFAHETDATQDLILSAYYFPTDEQQPKLATSQVGIEWELTLE